MISLFLTVVRQSVAASWLIGAVILLRFALKSAPKWMNCVLWALVAVRLLCPISLESPWSLIPHGEGVLPEMVWEEDIATPSGDTQMREEAEQGSARIPAGDRVEPTVVLGLIWLAGCLGFGAFALVSVGKLRRRLRPSLHLRENLWVCDEIETPFILGIFRPRIYIPSGTEERLLPSIIAHEKAHLQRRDHWWKPLGFVTLAIHWMNPLVWAAYGLFCRDIELACDEKVTARFSRAEGVAYSEALLACSVKRRTVLVCPLAFGEVGVKERVRHVLNHKKPAVWVTAAALLACAVLALCFLTNPPAFPLELRQAQISGAAVLDMRTDELSHYALNPNELEELEGRIQQLRIGRENADLQGFTPLYSLTAETEDGERLEFVGFDLPGNSIALRYGHADYEISDGEFSAYLRSICAGENRDPAAPGPVETASGQILTGKIEAAYRYTGDEAMESAFLCLYDNGEFSLDFSPFSSYWGYGHYTVDGGRLRLETDDGNFVYVFAQVEDTLVFDGKASSDMVWFSGLEDGSVLYGVDWEGER